MRELTKDEPRRLKLLGITGRIRGNDIQHFDRLSLKTLKILLEEGFVDPQETQNCAPSVDEMYMIGQELEALGAEVTFHGYAVSPNRDDYRISLEGVEITRASPNATLRFVHAFRSADEFNVGAGYGYCWYD